MEERKDRMPPRKQLIACVIRQYDAGLYPAWVSLDKGHMVCLGAYQDEASATETIDRFLGTYQEGRIKTPEDILTHINSSCAQDLTAPLLVIGQSLGETAARRPVYNWDSGTSPLTMPCNTLWVSSSQRSPSMSLSIVINGGMIPGSVTNTLSEL